MTSTHIEREKRVIIAIIGIITVIGIITILTITKIVFVIVITTNINNSRLIVDQTIRTLHRDGHWAKRKLREFERFDSDFRFLMLREFTKEFDQVWGYMFRVSGSPKLKGLQSCTFEPENKKRRTSCSNHSFRSNQKCRYQCLSICATRASRL